MAQPARVAGGIGQQIGQQRLRPAPRGNALTCLQRAASNHMQHPCGRIPRNLHNGPETAQSLQAAPHILPDLMRQTGTADRAGSGPQNRDGRQVEPRRHVPRQDQNAPVTLQMPACAPC